MTDLIVKELTMDSRRVKPGDLFIAVRGSSVDGRAYITNAIEKGAVAILAEFEKDFQLKKNFQKPVPIVEVPGLRKLTGHIAARFYSEPSKSTPVIGITGTNGKTSTSHFIAQLLNFCEIPCAVMGTLGIGFLGSLNDLSCTTPDPIIVQRALADLSRKGAKAVAMEVTSHALEQSRVEGVHFHTAIFTNLTRDHLDYHGTLENYWLAKKKLFTEFQPAHSVINLDDEHGKALIANELLRNKQAIIGYTTFSEIEDSLLPILKNAITTHNLILNDTGIKAFIRTPWGEGELCCPLFGRFNLSNLLAAIAAVCLQGVPLATILKKLPLIKPVPGRMTCLGGKSQMPLVIIDYAHTPDALMQVLTALRQHCHGKLWCVFGCGGDRDRGKRALMASVAENFSDHFIITQDNSRTEDPKQICNDMIEGLKFREKAMIEMDRKKAIDFAIQAANAGDVVVVAGKGHEDYQIIGTEKKPFSDQAEAQQSLLRKII